MEQTKEQAIYALVDPTQNDHMGGIVVFSIMQQPFPAVFVDPKSPIGEYVTEAASGKRQEVKAGLELRKYVMTEVIKVTEGANDKT